MMILGTPISPIAEQAVPPRTSAERDDLIARLDGPGWATAAASLLADLGYRLIGPDRGAREQWHLLIALRGAPTERHFDPELVAYYAPAGGGAAMRAFALSDLGQPGAVTERRALWGHVHVADRVPVENRFLTFGGRLRCAVIDEREAVVDVASPGPIVRWGGHSQGTDELAQAVGAFFGRLIVPVNFVPGAAARIDAVPPPVLYRAFLADALRRAVAAEQHGTERTGLGVSIAAAWQRARSDPDACDAAQRLLRELRIE